MFPAKRRARRGEVGIHPPDYFIVGEASHAAGRTPHSARGLAQGHPVPAGRGEQPTWVGGAGGGSVPCVAGLGIRRARPYTPPAHPCPAAAAGTGTAV